MPKAEEKNIPDDKKGLLSETETLKSQIKRLKLEKVILERTAEIIKKDPGADPKNLINKEKATLADALRSGYPMEEFYPISLRP